MTLRLDYRIFKLPAQCYPADSIKLIRVDALERRSTGLLPCTVITRNAHVL